MIRSQSFLLLCKALPPFLPALLLFSALSSSLWSQAPGGGGGAAAAAPAATGATAPGATTGTTGTNGVNSANGRNGANDSTQTRNNRDNNTDENGNRRNDVPAGSQDPRTEFQQMVEATTGRRLPIYGASLFQGVPTTFAPVDNVAVGPNYIIGPGDEVDLQISGQINQQLHLVVDPSGAIAVPDLGAVHVAGLPYSQLPQYLQRELGRIYRNFTVDAKLGSLRTIQVFVVGQARRPGTYSISSLSTLTNAVFASGGPLSQGTLRDIQVKRGGHTIDHFDLYDLILAGNKTHDTPLQSGDVIFIPFVGPQVAVVGSVDNPAIYELKGPTTVTDALALAGGETAVAAGSTLRLERVYEHSMRSIEDVNLIKGKSEFLQNGDIISLTSVIDRFRDAVTLRGNVANPGRYVWHPGMRISDLIPNRESLITRNYWRKRNELGQIAQDYVADASATPNPEEGEGALEVRGNQSDKRSDSSSERGNASGNAGGSSVGAALTGNNSPFSAKTDVILSAPDIYWNYAVIERQSTTDLTTSLIPFNLGKIVLEGDSSQNYELLPSDVVTIFSKADLRVPSTQQTRYVRLEGEFNAAGVYSVLPGETLRGLLRRVGGFTPDAYLYASEFTRESTRRVEQQRLQEYAAELDSQIASETANNQARAVSATDQVAASASQSQAQRAVQRLRSVQPIGRIVLDLNPNSNGIDAVPDIALEDGDRFLVPRVPASVTVEGQVYNANAFVYSSNERVLNYLQRAGGPDRQADKKRLFVLRADGSVVSKQYGNVERAPIFPGDTVVVPPQIDRRSRLQRITDLAQIAGNLGFAVAAAYVITR